MLVMKRSATYFKDLKITRHFPRVQAIDCLYKGIEFTQSHRPEEAIADSYDKCEPGLSCIDHAFNENLS